MMMNIVFYTDPRVYGGLLKHVGLLGEELLRQYRVSLIIPEAFMEKEVATVIGWSQVQHCIVKGKFDLKGFLRLYGFLKRTHPDIFHVHLASPGESTLAFVAASLSEVPVVIATEHSPSHYPLKKFYSRITKRMCVRSIDTIIALSSEGKGHLVKAYSIDPGKIQIVHNGIRGMRVLSDDEKGAMKRHLNIDGKATVITTISEITERKGIGILLQVARELLTEGKNICFLLIGEGSARSEYEERYRDHVSAGRIVFTGYMSDVVPHLSISDLFVCPSFGEEMPLSILEAMAAKVPIIATAVGGIPEIIRHNENGCLVKPHESAALYSAISHLMEDKESARILAEKAFEDVTTKFSLSSMVDRTEEIYISLLRKKEGAA